MQASSNHQTDPMGSGIDSTPTTTPPDTEYSSGSDTDIDDEIEIPDTFEGPLEQPVYDNPNLQLLNDIARDETLPPLVRFIAQGQMGSIAKNRLIVMGATFLSKNQVFSNIENTRDFLMARDDMIYADKLSTLDFTTYDLSADYLHAKALLYASHNIRLRRSRKALSLRQLNTQRSESVSEIAKEDEEDRRLRSKIPFLGGAFS